MRAFVQHLKSVALPGVWSRAVQISRSPQSMSRLMAPEGEIKVKLKTPERPTAFEVTLWPQENDAHCTCLSPVEPCSHAIAVAIAMDQGAFAEGQDSTGEDRSVPPWKYVWIVKEQRLFLERWVRLESGEWISVDQWSSYLAGVQSGRVLGPVVAVSQTDLRIEAYLQARSIDHAGLMKWVSELGPIELLETEKEAVFVRAQKTTPGPRGRLFWSGASSVERRRLCFESLPDLEADQVFANGYFRSGDRLYWSLSARKNLSRFEIEPKNLPDFLLNDLPKLQERYEIDIQAELPSWVDAEPKIVFDFQKLSSDSSIVITANIVYPEITHLQGNRLVRPRSDLEQKLRDELRHRYGMRENQPLKILPEDLIEVRQRFENPSLDALFLEVVASQVGLPMQEIDLNQIRDFSLVELLLTQRDPVEKKLIKTQVQALLRRSRSQPEDAGPVPPLGPLSATLWNRLRPYQREGVRWLLERKQSGCGAILADEMGLGKTLQALAIVEARTLVVVPTSLIYNWTEEFKKFRPELKVCVYHGSGRQWDIYADVILTTYGVVRSETARFYEPWSSLILDEAHQIRNAKTQTAGVILDLPARFRLALTGTPIQNRVEDLVTLLEFISPQKKIARRSLPVYLLRRTKAEVLTDLPEKTRIEHHLELSPQEQQAYLQIFSAARQEVLQYLQSKVTNTFTLFETLLRSREVCNHIGLVDRSYWNEKSTKIHRLMEILDELIQNGHSVLVYSQWTRFLDRVETEILSASWKYSRLDGSTRDRGKVIEEFQSDRDPRVFLLSLHAGGVGLNLTRADHVIFCEPWWNPFVEFQAEDRVHRIGQTQAVTIHRLLCQNTIEMRIRELQIKKAQLGEQTLNRKDEEMPVPQLTLQDIEWLLTPDP